MPSRAEKRATERAGRSCLFCGGPIDARRSTRHYCSTRCRVAAHAARGTPREELTGRQVRILRVLAMTSFNRQSISERADIRIGDLPKLIGQVDERRRASDSLLALKLVEDRKLPDLDGGRPERFYTITQEGREALAVALTTDKGRAAAERVDKIAKQLKEEQREEDRLSREEDRIWMAQHKEERLRHLRDRQDVPATPSEECRPVVSLNGCVPKIFLGPVEL
jgi:hypothetical protein